MTLHEYISNLNRHYKLGNATEHTFRGDLQQLIESMELGRIMKEVDEVEVK